MRLLAEPAPSLPKFSALLVHGTYPSSALIQLCLSILPGQRAILLSPTRQLLLQSLASHNDDWLQSCSGSGAMSSISSRVCIFYPPSPKHLVAFLTSLHCHSGATTTDGVGPKAMVDPVPCLLVLYEPSAYFLQENVQDHHTISSYLLLVTHARALVQFFASMSSNLPSPSLVVFDRKLDQLKLPVLRLPSKVVSDPQHAQDDIPRSESVVLFVEKYFDMVGTFQSARLTLQCNGKKLCLSDIGGSRTTKP